MVVPLADLALATSGDYRNYFVRDGVRVSHTIDPNTGRPITHNLASVSVIHTSCMTADGLATALSVLGPDEGFELAERQDIAAYFLVRVADDVFEERQTSVWATMIENSSGSGLVD
jgi:thiamine biosynthesis lipoprotein